MLLSNFLYFTARALQFCYMARADASYTEVPDADHECLCIVNQGVSISYRRYRDQLPRLVELELWRTVRSLQ